ncbi:MAG TPA: 5,6-dimethylbenzimidazole synthase [Acidimicrobiales bacterium]|nr:5,6-dimethylbenzimidazole synthase [Acidimicrobiales bacterium]
MSWPRPVPVVGDPTSAGQRAADPGGWAFRSEQRDALYAILASRRDIRRFRPDRIDPGTVRRILEAAHAAPSVGHSQPWRFVVVTEPGTREQAALMADRERHRQASGLEEEAERQMLDLQLDGIREAPIGLVVCCDRRARAEGVLGRATYVDADLWSCACAIENLWLAARAEGLGVGWVTLFRPEELALLLGLPDGVETLGWLCIGWPDERPPEPGLERAGWSQRQPLDEVVIHERWPSEGPQAPASRLRAPDPSAVVAARDDAHRLLTPPGSLGVLDRALERLDALGIRGEGPVQAVIAAADHPVRGREISTFAASVTREILEATLAGESLGATTARATGAEMLVIDAGVDGGPAPGATPLRPRDPRGDLATSDALSTADVNQLLGGGRQLGKGFTGRIVVLGEIGIGNTTVAAALAAGQLGLAASEVVGLGAGGDTATLERKRTTIEAALSRARGEYGRRLSDPLVAMAALGGPEIAVLAGIVLGAVEGGSVVVLDGLATSVAAVAAVRIEPAVAFHLVAGQRSRERVHHLVLAHLGLEPLLDLRFRAGEGIGGLLAAQMLVTAARARGSAGRVDETTGGNPSTWV